MSSLRGAIPLLDRASAREEINGDGLFVVPPGSRRAIQSEYKFIQLAIPGPLILTTPKGSNQLEGGVSLKTRLNSIHNLTLAFVSSLPTHNLPHKDPSVMAFDQSLHYYGQIQQPIGFDFQASPLPSANYHPPSLTGVLKNVSTTTRGATHSGQIHPRQWLARSLQALLPAGHPPQVDQPKPNQALRMTYISKLLLILIVSVIQLAYSTLLFLRSGWWDPVECLSQLVVLVSLLYAIPLHHLSHRRSKRSSTSLLFFYLFFLITSAIELRSHLDTPYFTSTLIKPASSSSDPHWSPPSSSSSVSDHSSMVTTPSLSVRMATRLTPGRTQREQVPIRPTTARNRR
ncbi:hypothetical protein PGTUg99_000132 [Puccinia graminis f. sp. tritici]|uniref:ABC transporter TMD0 domain-containing protein n=1 Tax=Puccinia graminis f. sp. tritici TaxID=56615 RepID=A0A5B0QDS5_PUCGR|nr:hypothetical protein PGTUg99_000132 [Puccinia graminis f. sp. tritici]